MTDPRPVLFVTNHAPGYRVDGFRRLAEREGVEYALVGGDVRHGGGGTGAAAAALPARSVRERDVFGLAASGRYRAIVAGLSGRVALPSAYAGARRARVPFVLWATIWAHPRTPAHALSYLPLRHIYRDADAIATYGPHVSAYVRGKGARAPIFEAPQAVDNAFWSGQTSNPQRRAPFQAAFVGRMTREKGLHVLLTAWHQSGLSALHAALVLVGGGRFRAPAAATGAVAVGPVDPPELRNFYAGSDVVVLPSIPTRDFREPWGLVANEAMNQGLPVIASDAVGAAAGGLVEHERTGLVVPAGDAAALAGALRRLHDEPALRERLGATAREAVAAYTGEAWAAGLGRALTAVGVSRNPADRVLSVNRLMPRLRLILVVVLGLLALAPTAGADTRNNILRDCEDDDQLQGSYSPRDLRDARNSIPSDKDIYSACRDVLAAALAADGRRKAAGSGASTAPGAGGAIVPGTPGAATAPGGSSPRTTLGRDPGAPPAEASPKEKSELRTAREELPEVDVHGQKVVPGVRGVAGSAANATLPTSLIAVLVLLGVTVVLAAVPAVRRRVLARRTS